jgi:dynactin 5
MVDSIATSAIPQHVNSSGINHNNNDDDDSNNNNNNNEQAEEESYLQTTMTQNFIARSANILSVTKVLELKGRCILHSNVQIVQSSSSSSHTAIPIRIGRYCHIQANTVLRPPISSMKRYIGVDDDNTTTTATSNATHTIMTIGSHTMIGENCSIEAMSIGCNCIIQSHVTLGPHVVIKDNCIIESRTTIPPHTVIPPFSRCYNSSSSNNSALLNISNSNTNLSCTEENTITPSTTATSSTLATSEKQKEQQHPKIEWRSGQRRHVRLIIDTSLPPSIATIVPEMAMSTYDAFVQHYRDKQQQQQQQQHIPK